MEVEGSAGPLSSLSPSPFSENFAPYVSGEKTVGRYKSLNGSQNGTPGEFVLDWYKVPLSSETSLSSATLASSHRSVREPPSKTNIPEESAPFHGKIIANSDGVICFFINVSPSHNEVFELWPVSSDSYVFDCNTSSSAIVPRSFFPFHVVAVVPPTGSCVQYFSCPLSCSPAAEIPGRYRDLPVSVSQTSEESPHRFFICLICGNKEFKSEAEFLHHAQKQHDLPSSESFSGDPLLHSQHGAIIQSSNSSDAAVISWLRPAPIEPKERSHLKSHPVSTNGFSDSEAEDEIPLQLRISHDENEENGGFGDEEDSDHSIHSCPEDLTCGVQFPKDPAKSSSIECPKCDVVLGSSKSLGGHMTMVHSRNSSKKLKCPKCNWHYKYQETLEIHMKEKHSESEETCPYCLTNRTHPRLARGEVYSCGYKPYRCEICNYSTTSKGNLTIHMQSDKHVNNIQERHKHPGESSAIERNSPVEEPPQIPRSASVSSARASFRCDVCNYETNVSRNLRIHNTSEKHQQNYNLFLQARMQEMTTSTLHPGGLMDHTTIMSLMNIGTEMISRPAHPYMLATADGKIGGKPMTSRTACDTIPENAGIFQCLICVMFMADSAEELWDHLSVDRTENRQGGAPNDSLIINGTQSVCRYCHYKTTLKANFQLHCKTDKHLQKMQLVNHVREGGPGNEWRLQYLNTSNPVQVRCNACDYQTNSIHQLRVHFENNQQHEINSAALRKTRDLQLDTTSPSIAPGNLLTASSALISSSSASSSTSTRKWKLFCSLCNFASKSQSTFMQHVRSAVHLSKLKHQETPLTTSNTTASPDLTFFLSLKSFDDDLRESNARGRRPSSGSGNGLDRRNGHSEDEGDSDECASDSEKRLKLENPPSDTEDTTHSDFTSRNAVYQGYICPLCQESCQEKDSLEIHLIQKHNVHAEALERLIMLVETSGIWNRRTNRLSLSRSRDVSPSSSDTDGVKVSMSSGAHNDSNDIYRCQKCAVTFVDIEQLYQHQNASGHLELKQTPRGPGYLCWKKGCNQYFKTANSLQTHFREIHARKSIAVGERHTDSDEGNGLTIDENSIEEPEADDEMNSHALAESGFRDPNRKYKCHRCRVAFTKQIYLTAHNKTLQHRKGEKNNSSIEKFLDPNRPHKCEVCKESFTQKNILLVHYNSVSHLHKLKKFRHDQDQKYSESVTGSSDSQEDTSPRAHSNSAQLPSNHSQQNGRKINFDDENKPYRCSICKVAYTSSMNLDIHMRSVGHQGKLARSLQEIQNTSAMDLTKPITDEPIRCTKNPSPTQQQTVDAAGNLIERESTETPLSDMEKLRMVISPDPAAVLPTKSRVVHRGRSNVAWISVLENIGAEMVQQFLENAKKPAKKPRDTTMEPVESESVEPTSIKENICSSCHKVFSTPWILKIHRETAHADIIPVKMLEAVAAEYRKIFMEKPRSKRPVMENIQPPAAKLPDSPTKKATPPSSSPAPSGTYATDLLAAQMQLLPLLYPGLGMGGLGMMGMQAAMMNLQPPLMNPNGGFSLAGLEAMGLTSLPDMAKTAAGSQNLSQKMLDLQAGQKRNRTRITDEQLQILRGNFDIRNPPSDELLLRLCEQTGLELKVVKHWYRNTLFKERQRNKDSPYNFSVPPNPSGCLFTDNLEKPLDLPPVVSSVETPLAPVAEFKKEPEEPKERMLFLVRREESVESADSRRSRPDSSLPAPSSPSPTPTNSAHSNTREDRHSGKRANRTRFTDFQIKALQDYFDKNAYPKDDDLEELSRALGLSPRVITVWFQNARQKARKSYENQTPPEEEVPIIRTPSLNYQCKKCLQVFQRYYELIRHQRAQCSGTSAGMNSSANSKDMDDTDSIASNASLCSSKVDTVKSEQSNPQQTLWDPAVSLAGITPMLGTSPFGFPGLYPPNSPFGVLQMEAVSNPAPLSRTSSPSLNKRRASSDDEDEESPANKRVRTTIQPEQLDYLYQQYKTDSNPSRKQLEMIATKTGLKKRVVQVWYQNTRARERKGQLHLQQLSINKRCPVCRLHFKVRSALESHISVKHADIYCKGDVNIEDLPDTDSESYDGRSNASTPLPAKTKAAPLAPSITSLPDMKQCMKQYYDDVKRYLQPLPVTPNVSVPSHPTPASCQLSQPPIGDTPLDLSSAHPKPSTSGVPLLSRDVSENGDERDIEGSDEGSSRERSMGSNAHRSQNSKTGKRFRTQMSNAQLSVLKRLFADYKTPAMGECELVGHEIGLQKRVVQVWFQNARAKEKKNKLAGVEPEKPSEHCSLCNVTYSSKLTLQDHLFTKSHIDLLKISEDCREGPSSSSDMMARLSSSSPPSRGRPREMRPSLPVSSSSRKIAEVDKNRSADGGNRRQSTVAVKSEAGSGSVPAAVQMNPFGDLGALMMGDPNMMAYAMYASMNPYYSPVPMSSLLNPYGGLAGAFYDPNIHGTSLAMLQLPPGAAELIYGKLHSSDRERSASGTNVAFAQDGKRLSDLKDEVSAADFACATTTQSDMGSVCRKCQTVFPSEASCKAHQSSICYPGSKDAKSLNLLKLMQMHFHCSACQKQFSTVDDFRNHCRTSSHQKNRQQQATSPLKRPSSSAAIDDLSVKRSRHE